MNKDYVPDQEEIEATKKSIRHWKEDILGPLERGRHVSYGIYEAEHCALCNLTRAEPDASVKCESCPFYKRHGRPCSDTVDRKEDLGVWDKFVIHKNPANARAMIQALEEILPPTPAGGIMEGLEAWWNCNGSLKENEKLRLRAFQAIEARFETQEARVQTLLSKVGELKAEIEEVDNRRYGDHIRINEHDGELETLKTEIGGLRNNLKELIQTVCKHSRQFACLEDSQLGRDLVSVERKVASLEKDVGILLEKKQRVDGLMSLIRETSPSHVEDPERSRRTQAPDSKGDMHDLRLGVSVCSACGISEGLYLGRSRGGAFTLYTPERSGQLGKNLWIAAEPTWLFDLDLPGGDK